MSLSFWLSHRCLVEFVLPTGRVGYPFLLDTVRVDKTRKRTVVYEFLSNLTNIYGKRQDKWKRKTTYLLSDSQTYCHMTSVS